MNNLHTKTYILVNLNLTTPNIMPERKYAKLSSKFFACFPAWIHDVAVAAYSAGNKNIFLYDAVAKYSFYSYVKLNVRNSKSIR